MPITSEGVEAREIMAGCDAVLLPGSNADLDPARFSAAPSPHNAPADNLRDAVDALLLDDAYRLRKPILGICYGLQSLNVHRGGSLIQHIPDFLPELTRDKVNHEAGRAVGIAHTVEIERDSLLAEAVSASQNGRAIPVNSSHHQSVEKTGDGLRVTGRCPEDGIVEAVEGIEPNHFVVGVQWHPERSVDEDEASLAIFRALVQAARRT